MIFTFSGSQSEIVEQMELMREYIASRAPHELIKIKRTDIIVQVLPEQPKPQEYVSDKRVITAQDNSCPNPPHVRGTE